MLDQLTVMRHGGERVFESQIEGRVSIHPSAEIRSSIIRGPVAIGAGDTHLGHEHRAVHRDRRQRRDRLG